jgi:AcrR family transcriptional regulator
LASDEKTGRIIDAAAALFLKHGLRGTSMEAIARQARIAKPTLYAYFPDKDAVFRALVGRLIVQWRETFLDGLRSEGDVVARIGAALTNKNKAAMRLLAGSPHADELYDEHDRNAGPQFALFEAEIAAAVEHELMLAGAARPRLIAQILLAAALGLLRSARSPAELGPAIRLLTERLVRPEISR